MMRIEGVQLGKRTLIEIEREARDGSEGHSWRAHISGKLLMEGWAAGAREEALFESQVILRDAVSRKAAS